jgi:hypothetical protein
MNLPITSRIKRSPLLETIDPNKRSKSEVATKIKKGADTEEEIEVPGIAGTDNYDAAVAAEGTTIVDPKEITQEMTDEANKKRADAKKADVAAAKPTTKKVIVKGKTTKGNNYSKQNQTRLGPADILRNQRSNKRSSRYVRQSKDKMNKYDRKMSQYGKRNAEGKFVANKGLSDKDKKRLGKAQSRYNEAENNNLNATSSASRVNESQASGKAIGQGIRRVDDRINTLADYSNAEQDKINADNALAQSNPDGITVGNETRSGQSTNAVPVGGSENSSTPLGTEQVEGGVKIDTTYKEAKEKTPLPMKANTPYKMMSNNPVSSNKVKSKQNFTKSPYQMRGSMFKK